MIELKSGIVLYPQGEVLPNIARQLGWVTNARLIDNEVVGGTVHAVAYDPELARDIMTLSYPFGESNDHKTHLLQQFAGTAIEHMAHGGFSEQGEAKPMNGRRIDLIAPSTTPEDGLALMGLLHAFSGQYDPLIHSHFDATARPWRQDGGGTFATYDNSVTGFGPSIGTRDFRGDNLRWNRATYRKVATTAGTGRTEVHETIESKIDNRTQDLNIPGIRGTEQIAGAVSTWNLNFPLFVSEALKEALKAEKDKLDAIDRDSSESYEQTWSEDDRTYGLAADPPEPVSRESLEQIASTIDPMDDPVYRKRLN